MGIFKWRQKEKVENSRDFWIESIKPTEHARQFIVKVKNAAGKTAEFLSCDGPERSYKEEPARCQRPQDILSLPRFLSGRRDMPIHPLERMWIYETKNNPPFLGTPDHHQLYFYLLKTGRADPNDVLLNADSHDDVPQFDWDQQNTTVNFGGYVINGFSETIQKAWDHYVLIAPQETHGTGMKKHLQNKSIRFQPNQLERAWEDAFIEAKRRGGKIIVSLDLDFFGSHDLRKPFNPSQAVEYLIRFFSLIHQYKNEIKLVHFTESLQYSIGGDEQVRQLYAVMAELMALDTPA